MQADLKKLFERYCDSKNTSPKSAQEMEPLLREFFGVINQDLVRAFYLNGFSRIKADIPTLIQPLRTLIAELPPLQDPRFQELRQQPVQVNPQRAAMLEQYLALYQLCLDEGLIAFQDDPSEASLTKLSKEFDTKPWEHAFTKLESGPTKVYDTRYHQISKKFLNDLNKVRDQIQNAALQKNHRRNLDF